MSDRGEEGLALTGPEESRSRHQGVRSGLAEAEHALQGVEGIAFQRFSQDDIIRHPVVGRIVEAYERQALRRGTGERAFA